MCNLFKKPQNSFFLSKIFRNIFCLWLLIISIVPLIGYSQNAYINDFRVNDDVTSFTQSSSLIGVDTLGNFVVAWNDKRNYATQVWSQVYCQLFDKNGNRIGNNFKVGQDTTRLLGLTMLNDGRFIIYWYNALIFNQYAELYYQRFDNNGMPLNTPTKVIDSIFSATSVSNGDISSDPKGNFLITWTYNPFATSNSVMYVQRFDSIGGKIGGQLTVNDTIGYFNITNTKFAVDRTGNFIVSWRDRRYNVSQQKYDIFFQRFDNNGVKIGNNIKVNDDSDTTKEQTLPWIDMNRNGNFVLTWSDRRNLTNDLSIYFQIYDSTGAPIGTNKRADESNGNPFNSKVALDELSKFIIGWTDDGYSGRGQYYGKRFKKTGDTLGGIYMIPQTSPPGSGQSPSDIKIWGDRIYSVWGDSRNGNNDIYCNVRSFQNPDTIIIGVNPISANIPKDFKLYPAYPNPFNPETKIKYDLPKDDNMLISIYDITGKTIKQINAGKQSKGSYEVTITNELLSSGVYFLKLQTSSGLNAVQKLVLLK